MESKTEPQMDDLVKSISELVEEQELITERIGSINCTTERSDRQLAKLRSLKNALTQDLLTVRTRVTDLLNDTEVVGV